MKIKCITAAILAASSLCAAPAAFAQDTNINSLNTIANSVIGDLTQNTNILNYSNGDSAPASDYTFINPINYTQGANAEVLNVINNIVDVNVNTGLGDLGNIITRYRASITLNIYN